MDADEELARKLQEEFDNEARIMEKQKQNDALLAQKIAKYSHDISDSDDDCEANKHVDLPSSSEDECLEISTEPNHSDASLNNEEGKQKGVKRPICKFGVDCYRKNPIHLAEFYHPEKTDSNGDASSTKRSKTIASVSTETKIQNRKRSFEERLSQSDPLRIFLNKIYSLPDTQKDDNTLVFPDLLHRKLGTIIESAQLTFMLDLEFVMNFYKNSEASTAPLLLVYGQMEGEPSGYENLTCTKVRMPFQYGVHHTKMMLFHYTEGVRIVILTANLVSDDWNEKTQGFWVSPLFPPLSDGKESLLEGDSKTAFKRDVTDYLLCYEDPKLTRWSRILRRHDFSTCSAFFVGSAPGYHLGDRKSKFGHMKCRALLQKWSKWKGVAPICVAQCSSIGSLGKDARSWLSGELFSSLSGAMGSIPASAVKLIYPSEDDVRVSSQGYAGGSCLPYNSKTHERQLWLRSHLHCWRSRSWSRTSSMPHIKTYTRLSSDLKEAQYFLLTSSNLSKAAWGQLQKQETQLFVRSYEAGVLLLPQLTIGEDSFTLKKSDTESGHSLKLPYDLPLTPYPPGATPWFLNTTKKSPDNFGNTYP